MGLKRVEHIRGAKKLGDWKGGLPPSLGEEGVIGAGAAPLFEPATTWFPL